MTLSVALDSMSVIVIDLSKALHSFILFFKHVPNLPEGPNFNK